MMATLCSYFSLAVVAMLLLALGLDYKVRIFVVILCCSLLLIF